MLQKINRLTKDKDFDLVFKEGESARGDFLIIKVLETHFKESRFGFVVSRKVSNKATTRNQLKRRLRKVVEEVLPEITASVDSVIVTLPGVEKKEFLQLQEMVVTLYKRLKLISP